MVLAQYRREIVLQGELIMAEKGRLELGTLFYRYYRLAHINYSSSHSTILHDLSYRKKSGQIFVPFCHYARV